MTSKKVLIVTYYWPPSGGGGVQRWVKFVKYLRQTGWEPIVFIPENPEYPLLDETLIKEIPKDIEIVQCKIWEPYKLYRIITGDKDKTVSAGFVSSNSKPSTVKRFTRWVRGNFFFPDARKFWIKPASKKIIAYYKSNPFDVIISTGPPHSTHLIAKIVQEKLNVPWLADFRDPWVTMDNEDQFQLSDRSKGRHIDAERDVLQNADQVVCVSWHVAKSYEKFRNSKIPVITNGFDVSDFDISTAPEVKSGNIFTIGHYGTFGGDRNTLNLWNIIHEIEKSTPNKELRLEMIGPTDKTVLNSISENHLSKHLSHIPYLDHQSCILKMKSADLLLVVLNNNESQKGRIPGKVFEYLAADKPILCIGAQDGDCARVIHEANAGKTFNIHQSEEIKSFISEVISGEWNNRSNTSINSSDFSRENLTIALGKVLDEMIS